MAQITAAVTAAAAAAVVSFRYFPQITAAVTAAAAAAVVSFRIFPACAGNTGFEFSRSATPAEVPANPPTTVTIVLYADRHVTWEKIHL